MARIDTLNKNHIILIIHALINESSPATRPTALVFPFLIFPHLTTDLVETGIVAM